MKRDGMMPMSTDWDSSNPIVTRPGEDPVPDDDLALRR
jgi:hypothetical protein